MTWLETYRSSSGGIKHCESPSASRFMVAEGDIEDEVDDFGEAEQVPENAVLEDDEPIQNGLAGEAQRLPEDFEGQETAELGAHRPQTGDMPRRSSRPVKRPGYLRDYVTDIDDL